MAAVAASEIQAAGASVPGVVRQRHALKDKQGAEKGGVQGALSDSLGKIRQMSSGPLPAQWRWVMLFILVYSTAVSVLTLQARRAPRGSTPAHISAWRFCALLFPLETRGHASGLAVSRAGAQPSDALRAIVAGILVD